MTDILQDQVPSAVQGTVKLVATVVAGNKEKLSKGMLRDLAAKTRAADTHWLAKNKAADLLYTGQWVEDVQEALKRNLDQQPFDIIVQPVEYRVKKLLVADMESTIIQQEMLDELATMIGVGKQVSDITRRAMNGELDFTAALNERVSLLKNLPAIILAHVAQRMTLMPGAMQLVDTMRQQGAYTMIVSGGFTYFANKIGKKLCFDAIHANELVVDDDLIMGIVAEPILDSQRKKSLLIETCAARGIELYNAVAIGDGANDIPMLKACYDGGGLGIAYHAKEKVRATISDQLNHTDLTTLLYAQGYHDYEFVQ